VPNGRYKAFAGCKNCTDELYLHAKFVGDPEVGYGKFGVFCLSVTASFSINVQSRKITKLHF